MAAPATAVVAGLVTFWLAVRSEDGLVIDDYYKVGLAINETLDRAETAARLGISAEIELEHDRAHVRLAGVGQGVPTLQFAHPTRSGMDQRVKLTPVGRGAFEARLEPLEAGRWHVVLEQKDWRLAGDWVLPGNGILTLRAATQLQPPRASTAKETNRGAQAKR